MTKPKLLDLSRRERQVLDVIYRLGKASAGDVQAQLEPETKNSAVRAILSTLEKKGYLRIERDGTRYLYHPTIAPRAARAKMIGHVIDTFFGGSLASAVSAMLDERSSRMTKEERIELTRRLRELQEEGR